MLPLFLLVGCASSPQDHWLGPDKAKHFVVSAALASAATAASHSQSATTRAQFGIGLTLQIGLGKEAMDSRPGGSGWSWRDLAWDLAGALCGYSLAEQAR